MDAFLFFKQLIVDVSRELVQKGYLSATGGNLSVRVSGQPAFAITPSNYDYMKMVPEDICVLDFALNPLDGKRTPSVESRMHAAIYQVRPDVNAIIHTHQVYPSTLAIIGKPIPALFDEQVRFLGGEVKIIPYAPSGTDGLKNKIAGACSGWKQCLYHGQPWRVVIWHGSGTGSSQRGGAGEMRPGIPAGAVYRQ